MATYKGIQGYSVQKLATDPTATDSVGQLWYNSTDYTFKIAIEGASAWASGGNMVVGRNRLGGCGTQTAGLAVGGFPPGGAPNVSNCEEYNGTTWVESTNYPVGTQSPGMAGTQTAALFISGGNYSPTASHTYNGASWTSTATRNTPGILRCNGSGTQTAALTTGGETHPWVGYVDITESYNGTAWSELATYPVATSEVQVMGTTTATIGVGGYPGGVPSGTGANIWNGASWSASTNSTTGRSEFSSSHVGASSTSGIIFGGNSPLTGATEKWNGTSWTEVGDMATARNQLGGGGNTAAALAFGGSIGGSITGATEEWSDPLYAIKTVTVS